MTERPDVARLAALLRESAGAWQRAEGTSVARGADAFAHHAEWLLTRGVTLAEAPPTAVLREAVARIASYPLSEEAVAEARDEDSTPEECRIHLWVRLARAALKEAP